MRSAVRANFVSFTAPLEGVVYWMYADVKNLITTGIGNLIDPVAAALDLPWKRPDGSRATRDEIALAWHTVKDDPRAAPLGHLYAARLTTLRLTPEDVSALVLGKLDANDTALRKRFPEWEQFPADAQLATHSMAWACGPAFRFSKLEAALRARDFLLAAEECHMRTDGNPGIVPRNTANRILYRNAALVRDPEVLYWPRDLATDPVDTDVPEDAPTMPVVEVSGGIVHSLNLPGLPGFEPPPDDAA